ncbi:PTS sugar transporter subunit IIA [bacterium]|nr:PTS sugar transporter subunit IIA [bacterium]MBU1650927.1 PTS sugar transporter subunit IIA [bacterium]
MLELRDLIKPEHIFLDLESNDRFDVIHQIVSRMTGLDPAIDLVQFEAEVTKREREIPTGLQMGAALPHARSKGIPEVIMAFARLQEGVDFGAQTEETARLVFLFGVPSDAINEYLKLVAKLCRLLREKTFRSKLLSAENAEEVIAIFQKT